MKTLYICFWKQLVHGLGYVFKTYWFDAHTAMPREDTTAMTSRKDVYRTLIFYFQKSGKLSRNYKKIAQSKRPRGWFYITVTTFPYTAIVYALGVLYSYILSHDVG